MPCFWCTVGARSQDEPKQKIQVKKIIPIDYARDGRFLLNEMQRLYQLRL